VGVKCKRQNDKIIKSYKIKVRYTKKYYKNNEFIPQREKGKWGDPEGPDAEVDEAGQRPAAEPQPVPTQAVNHHGK